jgi:bifunctional ADP-heptose synthase (sugar kinase/adenylyltransferase)
MVDVVVNLPEMKSGKDYNDLVLKIKPDVIAITSDDRIKEIKRAQAQMVGGKLSVVVNRMEGYSSSEMVERMI